MTKHFSKYYNTDIANALFRSGYIKSWGKGTLKTINECVQFGIPKPKYSFDMSGFWVEFQKDIFNIEYFKSFGLNERQLQAIKYIKENGRIINSENQENYRVARNTSTRDLAELVEKGILKSSGVKGAGSYYELHHNCTNCIIRSRRTVVSTSHKPHKACAQTKVCGKSFRLPPLGVARILRLVCNKLI